MKSIAIGCDEAACAMRDAIKDHLVHKGYEVTDYGTVAGQAVLYPDIAFAVSEAVAAGTHDRAILLCGTGIGMAMCANKVPGVRAAVCHDLFSVERSRKSNDAQILCMGARVIAPQLALLHVDHWLECEFEGGGSTAKVERMKAYETHLQR